MPQMHCIKVPLSPTGFICWFIMSQFIEIKKAWSPFSLQLARLFQIFWGLMYVSLLQIKYLYHQVNSPINHHATAWTPSAKQPFEINLSLSAVFFLFCLPLLCICWKSASWGYSEHIILVFSPRSLPSLPEAHMVTPSLPAFFLIIWLQILSWGPWFSDLQRVEPLGFLFWADHWGWSLRRCLSNIFPPGAGPWKALWVASDLGLSEHIAGHPFSRWQPKPNCVGMVNLE